MTNEIPRLDLTSQRPTVDRINALRTQFPEAWVGCHVDFDVLKRTLGEWVDPSHERFGLTWPGKAECMRVIQEPSIGTLVPMPDESVSWDETQNVIIEGENLEVLKLLQKAYYGKVKLIYIDPPYNTGKEFIYPDNFKEGLADYLRYSGQVDEEGLRLSANVETDGRYHSNWLSMMYPRLFLARNLLREDGLIFVSIDDHEVHNLRALMNEIYGEENFIAQLIWKKSYGGGSKTRWVVGLHEYVICFARNKEAIEALTLPPNPDVLRYYKFKDHRFKQRGPFRLQPLATTSMADRPNLRFPIEWEGEEIWPEKQWQWSRERVEEALGDDLLVIKKRTGSWSVDYKQYLKGEDGVERGAKPFSLLDGPYTQAGTDDLRSLGLGGAGFTFPKPVGLVSQLLQYGEDDDLVLDFFAGSGTTGHATMELNHADGGRRRYILVQLPEPVDDETFDTIASVTRERVRRAAETMAKLPPKITGQCDFGFRAFRLAPSNFTVWGTVGSERELSHQLILGVHHVAEGADKTSILTELLLKAGFPLTSAVDGVDFGGIDGYSVADGALVVCLSRGLTIEAFEAMVELDPAMILVLDAGFGGNDELKVNALQTVRARNQQRGSDITLRVV